MTESVEQKQQGSKNKHAERILINIEPNRLKALVKVAWPGEGEAPLEASDIKQALIDRKITTGINDQAIDDIIASSNYDEYIEVATGNKPASGADARLEFKFDKIHELSPAEDEDGRIDYKDINFIRSAEKGQVLVEKIPATPGVPGIDVLGNPVPALAGKDVKLPAGSNTSIVDDGNRLVASCEGSIAYAARKVNINEVHIVGGDVCTETGNINHNGSLIIRGNVETGFQVAAKGDIEIAKNVADAKVVSLGNILIKGGFLGSQGGLVKAGGDVHCKYVDGQIIKAGNNVTIGGEAFNSQIEAKNRVIVTGSKGRIVGGKVMAGDEIRTTIAGSDAGTRTVLQVAYDADLMKRYYKLKNDLEKLDENLKRVKEGLYAFYRLQMDGQLAPEKQAALKKLEELKKDLPGRKEEMNKQKSVLEVEIQKNQQARIIVVKTVYPGVVLHFGVIYKEITDALGPSYFQLSGSTITHEDYKPGKNN